MKKITSLLVILYLLISILNAQEISSTIILVKVKNEFRSNCLNDNIEIPSLKSEFELNNVESVNRMFKSIPIYQDRKLKSDISLIYELVYDGDDIQKAISNLNRNKHLEYAEPQFLNQIMYQPNDTLSDSTTNTQSYLNMHSVYQAWNVTKSDSTILVGVSDTGVKWDHEDLFGAIYRNNNDTIDGVDNDNDGYIDNYYGTDLADVDGDPFDAGNHGTLVSGCLSAESDNTTGIAGIGFYSKIVPLKAAQDAQGNSISQGYQSIVFGANKGYDILNLSWGCGNCYSQSNQSIIDYAVLDNDVVVIAAAGNQNNDDMWYPASYNNVLSVSGVDTTFERATLKSWNYAVDLVALGTKVYTTAKNGNYGGASGTSFAAPLVSGAAALVKDVFPSYSAVQIMEQIRVTTDSIYQFTGNDPYFEQLGTGSLNVFKAVTNTTSPSIRNVRDYNKNEDILIPSGDTVLLTGDFVNYLNPTSNLTISLSSNSPYVSMIDSIINVGVVTTMDTFVNVANKFSFKIESNTLFNEQIIFRFGYEDGSYHDFQYLSIIINPDFIHINENEILMTVNSTGNMAHNAPDRNLGLGLIYNGEEMLYEAGLMISINDSTVSNNIRRASTILEQDFFLVEKVTEVNPGSFSDYKATALFEDTLGITPDDYNVGVTVRANYYAWQQPPNDKFIIIEYEITNSNTDTLRDVHTGIFADWDIEASSDNYAGWNHEQGFGYVSSVSGLSGGFKPLWPYYGKYYAIDNNQQISGNPFGIYDGFTDEEKHTSLSAGAVKLSAGTPTTDVSHTVSVDMGHFLPNETKIMAFAIMAGDSLDDLIATAEAAQNMYGNPVTLQTPIPGTRDTLICQNTSVDLTVFGGTDYKLYYSENDYLVMDENLPLTSPIITDTTTFYISFDDGDFPGIKEPVTVYTYQPEVSFWLEPDTLYLLDRNYIYVHNTSPSYISVNWDFGNGMTSSSFNPSSTYLVPNEYEVMLTVEDSSSCFGYGTETLVVLGEKKPDNISSLLGDGIKIYPNPSENYFILEFEEVKETQIQLINAMGQIVKSIQTYSQQVKFDIQGLSSGIYQLKVDNATYKVLIK